MAVFGKNILENLTTGMYSDSRVVFREYVQNSCDAIASLKKSMLVQNAKPSIDITINQESREIVIRDNGIGVHQQDFDRVLSDIANSDKKKAVDNGFRGIGRLCGLAYCNELEFTSSAFGDATMSSMKWNARKMRTMLNDDRKHTATEVLAEILSPTDIQPISENEHFFQVVMRQVTTDAFQ